MSNHCTIYAEMHMIFDNDFDVCSITRRLGIAPTECKSRNETRMSPLTNKPIEGFWTLKTEEKEQEDKCFMSDRIYLNYDDIVKEESVVVDYLAKNSDRFSVTAVIKRPYSQLPPDFNYGVQLQPFVENYIFERKDWLVNFLGYMRHQIMVVCRCCKESRKQLLLMPNVFLPIDNDIPEDICFYRNGKLWFATISHEKIAFAVDVTKADLTFFKENGIKSYI